MVEEEPLEVPHRGLALGAVEAPAVGSYYVVSVGRRCGIFMSWREARQLVDGFPYNRHQRFANLRAAEMYLVAILGSNEISDEHRETLRRAME